MFEEPLNIPFRSFVGSFTSLVIWILIGVYGVHRFTIMNDYDDTIFNEFTVKNELSDNEFNQEELGFWIAFSAFEY